MDQTELCFTPAVELVRLVKTRQLSPLEIVDAVLNRIERINPVINAYCTLAAEQARAAARAAETAIIKSDTRGPLHGVPVSIKDLTQTRGIRTTFGCKLYEQHIPDEDALLVQRLKQAGAIILGKTNTPELGAGINTTNEIFGTTRNPWDLSRTCGGSSGGAAAALASGLGPLAEGSDHGGSLRLPASFCGVIGFRTTPGLIPRYPSAWGWDSFSVTGPMARTVADTALLLSVMAGRDDRIPISYDCDPDTFAQLPERTGRPLRIAWSPDLGIATVDAEVIGLCEQALREFEAMGCRVEQTCPDFSAVREIIPPLRAYRSAAVFSTLPEKSPDMEGVANDFFKQFLVLAEHTSIAEAGRAESRRYQLWLQVQQFFREFDLLICPATQMPAFPLDQLFPQTIAGQAMPDLVESVLLTYAITLLGVPAISIPAGWTAAGLPVGLQIIANRLDERTVLQAAAALERAAPWAQRRPAEVG